MAAYCIFLLLMFSVKSSAILNTQVPAPSDRVSHATSPSNDSEGGFGRKYKLVSRTSHSLGGAELDSIDPPTTTLPITNPVTTPAVTFPPDNNPAPVIITVPGTNTANASPNPTTTTPATFPDTNPPIPVTNPVTTPTTFPGPQPTANPITTFPPPSGLGNAPASPGQSWCIAKNGAPETALQSALDYACGIGGADCAMIQQGASCFNPNSLQNHASYAFNSYYQRNPVPTSCDFGGTAMITNANPSTGSCVYPSSSPPSSSLPPATVSPVNPTPIPTPTTPIPTPTISSTGSPPPGLVLPPPALYPGTPDLNTFPGGFGAAPPFMNSSTSSISKSLQPPFGFLFILSVITAQRLILGMQ